MKRMPDQRGVRAYKLSVRRSKCFELVGTEGERIDARHSAAGHVLEQRIGSRPFEVEHLPRSDHWVSMAPPGSKRAPGMDPMHTQMLLLLGAPSRSSAFEVFSGFLMASEATNELKSKFLRVLARFAFARSLSLKPLRG